MTPSLLALVFDRGLSLMENQVKVLVAQAQEVLAQLHLDEALKRELLQPWYMLFIPNFVAMNNWD